MNWTAREVVFPTLTEGRSYDFITGGSIEMTTETSVGITGTINFGEQAPATDKLLRIYCDGEPIATCFVTVATPVFRTAYRFDAQGRSTAVVSQDGQAQLYGMLKASADRLIGSPMTFSAGSNAINAAKSLLEDCKLTVTAEASSYTLSNDVTFDAGSSCIDIVLYLTACAGFENPFADGMGVVHLRKPDTVTAYTFAEGDGAVFEAKVTRQKSQTYNTARLYYESGYEVLTATAMDYTDGAPWREITYFEQISDLAGATQQERMASLSKMAGDILKQQATATEAREISCEFLPILRAGSQIGLVYAGENWMGRVTSYSFSFTPSGSAVVVAKKASERQMRIMKTVEARWTA